MGMLTIRNVDERTRTRLRGRAAENGRSVEAESVCVILKAGVDAPEQNFLLSLHSVSGIPRGRNLPGRRLPARDPQRQGLRADRWPGCPTPSVSTRPFEPLPWGADIGRGSPSQDTHGPSRALQPARG